jgi:4-aminobutyrate aminotransferase/(S)-3-amino-2-methylpropionate transaminase
VLDQMEGRVLFARAEAIGARFVKRASTWKERFPIVGDVRGLGAMWAVELVKDRATKAPAKEETSAVAKRAYERGLVTITAGTYGNVIRTLMPLVISEAELAEGLDVLEQSLAEVAPS